MAVTPRIFISATSGDLRTHRATVAAALKKLEAVAEVPDDWPHDYRTAEAMLRERIIDSDAVIHLAGLRYGAEPCCLPPGVPRRSYTQMEYHLARELNKPMYLFLLPDEFPFDSGAPEEDEECRALQASHREHIATSSVPYRSPEDAAAFEKAILLLYPLIEIHRAKLRTASLRRRALRAAAAVLILAAASTLFGLWWKNRNHVPGTAAADERDALKKEAEALMEKSRYAEAEPLIRRAIALDEARWGKDHPRVTAALNTLGSLLVESRRYAEAEPVLRRITQIDDNAPPGDHPAIAVHLNNYAQLLQNTGRGEEAGPVLQRALDIAEKSYGKGDPRTADALNSLGQWNNESGFYTDAEPLLRKAVALAEVRYGPDHPTTATFISNLGQLLRHTKHYDEAEPLLKKSLQIAEKELGPEHLKTALRLDSLMKLYFSMARLVDAEACSSRSLAILEKIYAGQPVHLTSALNSRSLILIKLNRPQEAEPLLRRALSILVSDTADKGRTHDKLKTVVVTYGDLLQNLGEEKTVIRERIAMLLETPGKSVPELEEMRDSLLHP